MIVLLAVAALAVLPGWDEIPVYPGARSIPLGDEITVAGRRGRVSYFSTNADPQVVVEHLASWWRTNGLVLLRDSLGDVELASAVDTTQRWMWLVSARREGGQTVGFVVAVDLDAQTGPPESPGEGHLP